MDRYFSVPFYKELTNPDGWENTCGKNRRYQAVRAIFKISTSQLPGPGKIGRKFSVFGAPEGISQEVFKSVELETEIFQETRTIEKSIIDSNSMAKILSSLSASYGDGAFFNMGAKVDLEASENIKKSFQSEFHVTNAERKKRKITYHFKNTVEKDSSDPLCGVAVYQECRADLYLLQIDFLKVEYKRSMMGLRKKLIKTPFPDSNKRSKHPNIIHIGTPVAELRYWELMPDSSLIIRDSDYKQEVENDSEIKILPPRKDLQNRPYWQPKGFPSLYQLSRVAFPYRWVDMPSTDLSKEQLMKIELGEAETTGWWFHHGPGKATT